MEAELFPRNAYALDKVFYRVELQRIKTELTGNLPGHPGIFRSLGIRVLVLLAEKLRKGQPKTKGGQAIRM